MRVPRAWWDAFEIGCTRAQGPPTLQAQSSGSFRAWDGMITRIEAVLNGVQPGAARGLGRDIFGGEWV